jgi:hypothetical protein
VPRPNPAIPRFPPRAPVGRLIRQVGRQAEDVRPGCQDAWQVPALGRAKGWEP